MATIFESLTDAEIEAMLAELENQQAAEAILAGQAPEAAFPETAAPEVAVGDNIFLPPAVAAAPKVASAPEVTGDESNIFQTPTIKAIGEGETGGASLTPVGPTIALPPFVTNVNPVPPASSLGFGIYDPETALDPELRAPELTGAVPGITSGGGIGGKPIPGPTTTVKLGDETITISFDELVNKEIQDELALMRQQGVFSSDPEHGPRILAAANRGLEIYNKEVARAKELGKYIDIGPKKDPETGMPLVIPIPGLDPTTALILTAAGLIFSGGNVAKFDPNDPLGSLAGAAQGAVKTGGNIIDVATGETNLGEIWKPGSTGAPSGGGGGGSATAGQQTTATGVPIPVGAGILSGVSGGGPFVGPVAPEQTTTTPTVIGVTPGAVGGETGQPAAGTSPTKTKPGGDVPQTGGPGAIFGTPSTTGSAPKGGDVSVIDQQIPVVTGGYKDIPETQPPSTTTVTGTPSGGTPSGGTPSGSTPGGGGGAGETPGPSTPVVVGTPPTGTTTPPATTTTTTTPPSTPIFMNDFTFTKTTPGQVALRDFEKEFKLTSSALMGDKAKELAGFYQQLQSQFTPSTLTQLAGTSQQQLMSDLDRLAMAQRGQLSPEDVRSAQQSAREAYAARGQVMAPGAIGAEILNRDVLRRQREAEARANVQQSMANLGAAAQLQTGNIFAPFAKLLAETYGPTSEYANAVYDYNVNAYNAYQAAQENLAAYKEAAAKGEEARFINSFVNFLANNGVQTTITAIENIFKKQAAKPTT